jgi:membrane protein
MGRLARLRVSASWRDIIKATIAEIGDDNCIGLAAQLAFYFFLALFPALLFLVALIGYLPVEDALASLLAALGTVAPNEVLRVIREQLTEISSGSHVGILTVGILGAVWSSSAAMVAIIDALNHAFDVSEWRSWWKRRLLAMALTMALSVFIIVSLISLLVGPDVVGWIAAIFGLDSVVATIWAVMRWPVSVMLIVLGVDLVYFFAPNRRVEWVWITPGSLVATGLWILGSLAFKVYVTRFGDYNATYGAIGGVMVLLLWFYVSGLAILVGAELNGVIERDAPPA